MKNNEKTNAMRILDRIFVSAGKVGFQVELDPGALLQVAGFTYADVSSDDGAGGSL